MIEHLLAVGADPGVVLLAGSGQDAAAGVLIPFLTGPAVFAAVYFGIYRYYRNTDKRHRFEQETEVAVGNLEAQDHLRGSRVQQKSLSMEGRNEQDHLDRVRRIDVS